MEATATTPTSLSLPCKTRFSLFVYSTVTGLARRKDGTVNRSLVKLVESRTQPTPEPVDGVRTYDVKIEPTSKVWFRVFVPSQQPLEDPALIVYFHGGGFVFLDPDVANYDGACRRIATEVPAIVVSVHYRLAPEHSYPTQHDDCFDVLKFLDDEENRTKSLPENANISRCFLAGDSAGGNLAHHVAKRASEFNFKQLKVIGVAAIQPFFGGEERTKSETELVGVPGLTLERADWYWNAFMPRAEGYNRDNGIINVSGPQAVDISKLEFPPTIIAVGGFDILQDWQRRYYEWLKKSGKEAYVVEYPNMFHGFLTFPELPESGHLISEIKNFIHKVLKNVGDT